MAAYETSSEVISDYTEVAIQFGYQALFVSALPCSSFFALISNVFEVKGDAWKLMNLYQRPVPMMCEDIGAFQQIFTVIAACSVISNAALMKFTLTVLNDFSQFNQWWIFVGFQWVMFAVMVGIEASIEDVAEEVKVQRQRAKYLEAKLIDHVGDDDVDFKPQTYPKIQLSEYPRYGSQVHFDKKHGGYTSEVTSRANSKSGSRANSKSGSFAEPHLGLSGSGSNSGPNSMHLPRAILEGTGMSERDEVDNPLTGVNIDGKGGEKK